MNHKKKRLDSYFLLVLYVVIILGCLFLIPPDKPTGAVISIQIIENETQADELQIIEEPLLNESETAVSVNDSSFIEIGDPQIIEEPLLNESETSVSVNDSSFIEISDPQEEPQLNNESETTFLPVGYITVAPDTCGYINSNKILTSNVTTTGTCFTINASNIILDGAGYTITSNGFGYGVNNTGGFDNITIRNFAGINNFSNGMYFAGVVNSIINNNTIQNSTKDGIYLVSSSNNNSITNNALTSNGDDGIQFNGGSNNNITSNTISSNLNIGFSFIGSSNDNRLQENNISNSGKDGIVIDVQLGT